MSWSVWFHPEIQNDLDQLGKTEAKRVFKVIRDRITAGEPDKAGRALSGVLAGFRRIRTGDLRIIYKVVAKEVILIACVGARRDEEVYEAAARRV